jgi:hypothetical protein
LIAKIQELQVATLRILLVGSIRSETKVASDL